MRKRKFFYVMESEQLDRIKRCPFCGSDSVSVYVGDYFGQTECLECDEEIEFKLTFREA